MRFASVLCKHSSLNIEDILKVTSHVKAANMNQTAICLHVILKIMFTALLIQVVYIVRNYTRI